MRDATATRPSADPGAGWSFLYAVGASVAVLSLIGFIADIVLTMLPGWGPESVPADPAGWLSQLSAQPWLGLRNLDFLNVFLSVVSLPLYVALYGAHRQRDAGLSLVALLVVATGTAVFIASNAALPMLELARDWSQATAPERTMLETATFALLARGEHGGFGATPAFVLSEIGTLLMAASMVRARTFSPVTGWIGVGGAAVLIGYSLAIVTAPGSEALIMAIAMPGGLLMVAWNVLVARVLWGMRRG